jgi:hypothetical protein
MRGDCIKWYYFLLFLALHNTAIPTRKRGQFQKMIFGRWLLLGPFNLGNCSPYYLKMWFVFTLVTIIPFGSCSFRQYPPALLPASRLMLIVTEASTSNTVYPLSTQLQTIRPLSKLTLPEQTLLVRPACSVERRM